MKMEVEDENEPGIFCFVFASPPDGQEGIDESRRQGEIAFKIACKRWNLSIRWPIKVLH